MKETWEKRIRRAEQLAADDGPSASLLQFYADLLRAQQQIFAHLYREHPTGDLTRDLPLVRDALPPLLRAVATAGPSDLAESAQQLSRGPSSVLDDILITYWHSPSSDQFFGKAIVQPYANCLAERAISPIGRSVERVHNRCPFCGGKPQLAVLDTSDARADGGGRRLTCSTCLSTWPFSRVQCANCGETSEPRLGYFHSPTYEHVRVEVCDTCRHYQKSVDRSRLGIAVPLVDDVAAAALDVWAREHGYTKIELNLVGL